MRNAPTVLYVFSRGIFNDSPTEKLTEGELIRNYTGTPLI